MMMMMMTILMSGVLGDINDAEPIPIRIDFDF